MQVVGSRRTADLARSLDLNYMTIDGYLKEKRKISLEFIQAFVEKEGVNAHWLLTGEGPMYAKDLGGPPPEPEFEDDPTVLIAAAAQRLAAIALRIEEQPGDYFRRPDRQAVIEELGQAKAEIEAAANNIHKTHAAAEARELIARAGAVMAEIERRVKGDGDG